LNGGDDMPKTEKDGTKSKRSETIMGKTPKTASEEIAKLYHIDGPPSLDICNRSYSNLAFVSVQPRDVIIDFLEAPATIEDGKCKIKATRVYLPLPAAKSLAKVLGDLIERAKKEGIIEQV